MREETFRRIVGYMLNHKKFTATAISREYVIDYSLVKEVIKKLLKMKAIKKENNHYIWVKRV